MDDYYSFALLQPHDVHLHWPELRKLLGAAVAYTHGEIEVDDILDKVMQGKMFVSVLRKGEEIVLAIAAEIKCFPKQSVLNVAFAGGRDGKVMATQFYDQLEAMGKIFNVSAVQCYCRPAVARYLKRLFPDVQEAYVVMRKEVTP